MKKTYILFALALPLLSACSDNDPKSDDKDKVETITFEDCEFPANQLYNIESGQTVTFSEDGADFTCTEYYSYFGGAVISSRHRVPTDGIGIPYGVSAAVDAENGGAGNSEKFCCIVSDRFIEQQKNVGPEFSFADGVERIIKQLELTNSTQMYQFFKYGFYSNAGLASGESAILHINGFNAAGNKVGEKELTLAKGTADGVEMVDKWTVIDLTDLGAVNKVSFSLETGSWTIPNGGSWSVCIDNIQLLKNE